MAKKSSKKSKKTLSVSFKGVDGKRKLPPEDDYKLEVDAVEIKDGPAGDYFAFTYKVAEGKHEGAMIYDNASTSEKSLWRLRSILECLGVEIDDEDDMDIDPEDLIGKTMMGVIAHEKDPDYGTKARLADFYAEEDEDEEDEDEEDKKPSKSKKKAAKKSSKKDDDDEDEESDEEDEEDADERKKRRRKERRAKRKGGDEDESEDDEDEDDKKSKSKKDKKAKKISADDVQDLDEDGLEELLKKHDLEVDLDDYKTLKKKAAAVIDALEDAKLLDDAD